MLRNYQAWQMQLSILWWGQTLLMAMLTMSLPFWPLYVNTLGHLTEHEARIWSTLMYIAPYFFCIFASPLWGKLGDKHGYKMMVVRASFGLFLTQGLIAICHNLFFIFLIRLLQGALAGFITAAQAWSIGISPNEVRSTTMGKLQSATAVGTFIGPLLGGIIITHLGYPTLFSLSAIVCGMITLLFFFLLQEAPHSAKVDEKNSPQNSFSFLNKRIIYLLLLTIVLAQLGRNMIVPVFALFVSEKLGGNNLTIGILYVITGLMIFISSPLWGKWFDALTKVGLNIYLPLSCILLGCALVQFLFAFAQNEFFIFILRACWGVFLGALLPLLLRLLINECHVSSQGNFLGWGNSAINLGEMLGMVTGAYVEAELGFENNFLFTALLYLILASMMVAPLLKQIIMKKNNEIIHDKC